MCRSVLMLILSLQFALAPSVAFLPQAHAETSDSGEAPEQRPPPLSAHVQAEVDASLEIAREYPRILDQYARIMNGEPTERLALDDLSLLQQEVPPGNGNKIVPWDSISVVLIDHESDELRGMMDTWASTYSSSLLARPRSFSCQEGEVCRFVFASEKHDLLNKFNIPVKAMALWGHWLVFVRPDSYDAEMGIQRLSVIDLEHYEHLIGNKKIPVNEIPMMSPVPITELAAGVEGRLDVSGGNWIRQQDMKGALDVYRGYVHIKANLLDPKKLRGALTQVETIGTFIERYVNEMGQGDLDEEIENGRRLMVSTQAIQDQLEVDLNQSANRERARQVLEDRLKSRRKSGREVVEHAQQTLSEHVTQFLPDDVAAYNRFTQSLERDQSYDQIIQSSVAKARASRKLIARIKTFAAHLAQPNPNAIDTIHNSVVGAVAAIRRKVHPTEAIPKTVEWMASHKLATAAVAGVVAAAVVEPAVGEFMLEGVQLTVNLGKHIGAAVAGFPMAAVQGLAGAASGLVEGALPVLQMINPLLWIPQINEAYIAGGNWYKTMIGLTGLTVSTALVMGFYHIGQNLVRLVRDMQKPEYRGFVNRQREIEDKYLNSLAASEAERRRGVQQAEVANNPEREGQIDQEIDAIRERNRQQSERGVFGRLRRGAEAVGRGLGTVSGFSRLRRWGQEQQVAERSRAKVGEITGWNRMQNWREERRLRRAQQQTPEIQDVQTQAESEAAEEYRSAWAQLSETRVTRTLKNFHGNMRNPKFRSALVRFIFSGFSYQQTVLDYTAFWNWWAGFRTSAFQFWQVKVYDSKIQLFIRPKPIGLAIRALYPRFFSTVVERRPGRHITPSQLNGGTDSQYRVLSRMLSNVALSDFMSDEATVNASREALEKFEDQILDIEADASYTLTRETFRAIAKYVSDPETLRALFQNDGPEAVSSASLSELNYPARAFAAQYYDGLYERVMHRVLSEIIEKEIVAGSYGNLINQLIETDEDDADMNEDQKERFRHILAESTVSGHLTDESLIELKNILVDYNRHALRVNQHHRQQPQGQAQTPALSLADVSFPKERLEQIIHEEATDPAIAENAKRHAEWGRLSWKNWRKTAKYSFAAHLDPSQNRTMERYNVVQRQRQDPIAVARATRSEVTEMFVTMPIDVSFKLLFTANIPSGIAKPVQDVFMGPNSVGYFSRFTFFNNFVGSLAMSMVGNSWVKMQEDAFNDDAGHFGAIPEGEQRNWSFTRWWWHHYTSPENSLWINYKRSWMIAWYNMPNAVPNIALFQWLFMGRVDLDLLLGTYVFGVIPLGAWAMKTEQAFERSAYYDAKDVPANEISHPKWQKFVSEMGQIRRVKFNLVRDVVFNPIGEAKLAAEVAPTGDFPNRGVMRSLLGGEMVAERVLNPLFRLRDHTAGVPGLNHLTNALAELCERIISNGNPELVRLRR